LTMSLCKKIVRREWPIILAFALPAAAMWGFAELADEVMEGSTAQIDRSLLLLFRNPADLTDPLGPDWFEEAMRDLTALGGFAVLTLITLGVAAYLVIVGKHRAAIAVLIAVAGGVLLSAAIKAGLGRPRPDLVTHGMRVTSPSFPSGHSMMAAVVYLTLAVMLARVRPFWRVKVYILSCAVLVTVLIGISRIYLGVHWPTDVLAGWSIGAAWALSCWLTTLLLQRRGEIEPEADVGSRRRASVD
jgi:undecaprenyl-diphosphatase